MKQSGWLLAPLLGTAILAACTSTTSSLVVACGPDDVATTNWDVAVATNYEAALYYGALDPIPVGFYTVASAPIGADAAPADPSAAAASAAAAAVATYFPNCANATAAGNVTTYTLNNCTGPLGLVGASGTVTATFNVVGSSVQIQLAGNGVHANGGILNLMSSGTLTAGANGQKTLQANTTTSGTGPDGNNVMRSGMYTLVWPTGAGCATINGTLNGVGSAGFVGSTQITNYVACAGKCPQSGSTTHAFAGGTVTLQFNGSNSAACTASNGTSASVPLTCP
jgi:hypothetical protein